MLISIQNEREFRDLCISVLGHPELPDDPRFSSNVARCQHEPLLDTIIQGVFGALDRHALLDKLRTARITYGEVNDVAALSRHKALRRIAVEAPHGTVSMAAPPGRDGPLGAVPALDQHGPSLRREFS